MPHHGLDTILWCLDTIAWTKQMYLIHSSEMVNDHSQLVDFTKFGSETVFMEHFYGKLRMMLKILFKIHLHSKIQWL